MPFQSIFINAFQNDIENSQLWQQTAAALQSNKFVQVCLKKDKSIYNFIEYLKEQLPAHVPLMYSINISYLASSGKEK